MIIILSQFLFQPIAVHESAQQFLVELGCKIAAHSGDYHEGRFCFSTFQFCCTALIQFCCTTVLCYMTVYTGKRHGWLDIAVIGHLQPNISVILPVRKKVSTDHL